METSMVLAACNEVDGQRKNGDGHGVVIMAVGKTEWRRGEKWIEQEGAQEKGETGGRGRWLKEGVTEDEVTKNGLENSDVIGKRGRRRNHLTGRKCNTKTVALRRSEMHVWENRKQKRCIFTAVFHILSISQGIQIDTSHVNLWKWTWKLVVTLELLATC